MNKQTTKRFAVALLGCMATTPAFADTATQVNAANELVREGEFAKAIESYSEITPTTATHSELNYNLGVAEYRQGDVAGAKAHFKEASTAENTDLAAAARYNLGDCFYAEAVTIAEKDQQAAIEFLDQAIVNYRASLRANRNHVDARANIELAVAMRKNLQEQQKQQQQSENQDQQKQNEQNSESQQSESQQDQKDQESENQDGESEQKKDQQGQSEQNKSEQEEAEKKQDKQQQSEQSEQTGKQDPASEQDGSQQQEQKSDQQSTDQSKQSPQNQQEEAEPGAEEQPEGESKAAPTGELKPTNEQQDVGETTNAMPAATFDDELMTKEEAMKMLQAVRDRNMLRRLRQEQIERSRHVPTGRDW